MVHNAVHNAFLNTLTMGTAFPRVPSGNDPCLFQNINHFSGNEQTTLNITLPVGQYSMLVARRTLSQHELRGRSACDAASLQACVG